MSRITRPVLIAGLLLSITTIGFAADEAAPLRLVGSAGGQEYVQFTGENGRLLLRAAPGTQPVPPDIHWRLEGDLRANADFILLRPDYEIVSRAVPLGDGKVRMHSYGIVRIERVKRWKDLPDGTVIVFAWLVDRRPVWVDVQAVSGRTGPSSDIAAITAVELEAGMELGYPVALAISGTEILQPLSTIRNEALRRAVVDLYLGSPTDFEQALEGLKSVNALVDNVGTTLLHLAAEAGDAAALGALHRRKANLHATGRDQREALSFAAANGRLAAVQTCLGFEKSSSRKNVRPAVRNRAEAGGHVAVALELLGHEGGRSTAEKQAMATAVRAGDTGAISRLLARGMDEDWARALPDAMAGVVGYRDPALTQLLLAGGTRADETVSGTPLLVIAARAGDAESVGLLLKQGAQVNRAASDGTTALMGAVCAGDLATTEVLLAAGADPLARDSLQQSALDRALAVQRRDVIELLLTRMTAPADSANPTNNGVLTIAPGEDCCCPFVGQQVFGTALVDALPVAKKVVVPHLASNAASTFDLRSSPTLRIEPTTGRAFQTPGVTRELQGVTAVGPFNAWAVVTFVVEPDGAVSYPRVLRANPAGFGIAVERALRRYEFTPGRRNGQPVRTRLTMAITLPE